MSFRLLSISSMYSGYLDSFYKKYPNLDKLSYDEHKKLLLDDTTEFVGAYLKNFRKLGIEVDCVICNDSKLQEKWGKERGISSDRQQNILIDQVNDFHPDVILVENLSYVTSALLRFIRQKVPELRLIAANHCSPFNSKVLDSLTEVDFVFTCTPGLKLSIEDLGKKSYLVYHGFDTSLFERLDNDKGSPSNNFIFSGSLITGGDFHARRIKLIEHILKEQIDIRLYVNLEQSYRIRAKQAIYVLSEAIKKLKLERAFTKFQILQYGKAWVNSYSESLIMHKEQPVFGNEMLNLFHNSKIILNFHIGVAGDFAGNMRMFEVTGMGSCLLTDNKKNMSDLFDTEREVVVYDNEEDCIEKVKWLLTHEDERKKIALAGQQKTITYHTVENRCRSIIEILNSELNHSGSLK
jgi:spore maturation protein CgeB